LKPRLGEPEPRDRESSPGERHNLTKAVTPLVVRGRTDGKKTNVVETECL